MKKVFVLAAMAVAFSGVAMAQGGEKSCCKHKGEKKECHKKKEKEESKSAKVATPAPAAPAPAAK